MTFQSQRGQIQPGNRDGDPDSTSCLASLHSQTPAASGTDCRPAGNLSQAFAGSSGTAAGSLWARHLQSFPTARISHSTDPDTTSHPALTPNSQKDRQRPRAMLNNGRLAEPTFTWPNTSVPRFSESPTGLRYRNQCLDGLVKEGNCCWVDPYRHSGI